MPKNPLDATFKRHNKKVYITLIHQACRTVVQRGSFPESCPVSAMTSWIHTKNELFGLIHNCPLLLANAGELAVHRSADARLF